MRERFVLGAGAVFAVACTKTGATPERAAAAAAPPVATAVDAASPALAKEPSLPVAMVPELAAEPFSPPGTNLAGVFVIEGATMVMEKTRVGRVNGGEIEWMKNTIPKVTPGIAENSINSIHGRYPDSVSVLYTSDQGRAPLPTYYAISGKWASLTAGGGGGFAQVTIFRAGQTLMMGAASSMEGRRIHTLSGPRLNRSFTKAQGLCKKQPMARGMEQPAEVPAIDPSTFGGTAAGTVLSVGEYCGEAIAAAEVWDKTTGKPRIVDLHAWWKSASLGARVWQATNDDAWLSNDAFEPVLRYSDGTVSPLPLTKSPIVHTFASTSGQLYAETSDAIYRFEQGKWTTIARLAAPLDWSHMDVDTDGTFWGGPWGKVAKLRETRRVAAEETCQSWFVFLYNASDSNSPTFTYPTTRRALADFPGAAQLRLVEYGSYPRRLGVSVPSMAQAEALVSHLKTKMPDERPRVFCHAPPANARSIELD